jgi:signal transduction histidine kinase
LKVSIYDEGNGLPSSLRGDEGDEKVFAAGVGIASMRERARELGGSMKVHSDDHGTAIEVRLPVIDS